jgi:hypothetical protein
MTCHRVRVTFLKCDKKEKEKGKKRKKKRKIFTSSCNGTRRVFRASSFMCVVYGFQLLVKVWIVFIVLALGVLGLLWW